MIVVEIMKKMIFVTQLADERNRGTARTTRLRIWEKIFRKWIWWLISIVKERLFSRWQEKGKKESDLSEQSRQLSLFLVQLVIFFLHFLLFSLLRFSHILWSHFKQVHSFSVYIYHWQLFFIFQPDLMAIWVYALLRSGLLYNTERDHIVGLLTTPTPTQRCFIISCVLVKKESHRRCRLSRNQPNMS